MAFLVQNDGGVITDPFWQNIVIKYNKLPIFLAPGQTFSQSDAQVLIGFYNEVIDEFNIYARVNGFEYNLQNNIFAMANSLAIMSQFAEVILTKNNSSVSIVTTNTNDLYTLMFNNNVEFNILTNVNNINGGSWYSALVIPSGLMVNMS
jgi:hypothetical protein